MDEGKAISQLYVTDREKEMPASQALKIPFSGQTRRRFTALAIQADGSKAVIRDVLWSLSKQVPGVTLDRTGLLAIKPGADEATIEVIASLRENEVLQGKTVVDIIRTTGRDMPANPLEKSGWKLYFNDEFDTESLNRSVWVDQYLRNWSDDVRSKTNYFFEDSSIVIKADTDSKRWSPYDPNENSSITSFETTYLHRFGSNVNDSSRIIPSFDGLATKYGYFEIRAKLPDTGDGSHVAWWMIGVQDDQNINTHITDPSVRDKRSSNETGEVDIIEIGLDEIRSWRPVMHPNESTSLDYLHVAETVFDFDPGNEFHIYGFEWDEDGTKYYLDNQLVQETDRTFDYRMMTFLGLYAQGGMGKANKIFPKEFAIDYFRVYKKDEERKANDICFTNPVYTLKKPTTTPITKEMQAVVLDQFDQALDGTELIWKFSESISGYEEKDLVGATIDQTTGKIRITKDIADTADLFVTAKVQANESIRKVCHLKVSTAAEKPVAIEITDKQQVMEIDLPTGEAVIEKQYHARIKDQYGEPVRGRIRWRIATGTTLKDPSTIKGVTMDAASGRVTIRSNAERGSYFFVQAISEYQAKEKDEYGLDNTIYTHQLVKLN